MSNNPIGIGEDGGEIIAPIYGSSYHGRAAYTSVEASIPGVGVVLFTYANDAAHYIPGSRIFYPQLDIHYSSTTAIRVARA